MVIGNDLYGIDLPRRTRKYTANLRLERLLSYEGRVRRVVHVTTAHSPRDALYQRIGKRPSTTGNHSPNA